MPAFMKLTADISCSWKNYSSWCHDTMMCYSQIISTDGLSCVLWKYYWIFSELPFTLIVPGKTGRDPASVLSWCEYNVGPQMDFPVYVNTTLTCQTFRFFSWSCNGADQHLQRRLKMLLKHNNRLSVFFKVQIICSRKSEVADINYQEQETKASV